MKKLPSRVQNFPFGGGGNPMVRKRDAAILRVHNGENIFSLMPN